MQPKKPGIEQLLTSLAGAPGIIAGLTAGLSEAQLHAAPSPGEWSANQVLAHLRACADVWDGCMARIINEEMPTIRAVSPRTYMRRTDYPELDFQPSLGAYTLQRGELLKLLESLAPEAWRRSATVIGVGKPFVHTVLSYADRLASHERQHLRQMENTAGALK
jgi:hypothetical protein